MQNDLIQRMTELFEGHAQETENGVEYWLARDVQHLLGYAEWRNFLNIVTKAKTACEVSDHPVQDHFVDINKMVELGSGSQREINDNQAVRQTLLNRGIRPESLPPAEDVKKVERHLASAEKKALKNPKGLENE